MKSNLVNVKMFMDPLTHCSLQVTFTTLTNFVAFMVASVTPVNIVSWFASMLAVAVVTHWFFLMMLFVPAMRLHGEFCVHT